MAKTSSKWRTTAQIIEESIEAGKELMRIEVAVKLECIKEAVRELEDTVEGEG